MLSRLDILFFTTAFYWCEQNMFNKTKTKITKLELKCVNEIVFLSINLFYLKKKNLSSHSNAMSFIQS